MWMEGLSDAFRLRWKLIRATPPEDRSLFAKQIWERLTSRILDHQHRFPAFAYQLHWSLTLFAKQIWQRRHERGTDHGVPF